MSKYIYPNDVVTSNSFASYLKYKYKQDNEYSLEDTLYFEALKGLESLGLNPEYKGTTIYAEVIKELIVELNSAKTEDEYNNVLKSASYRYSNLYLYVAQDNDTGCNTIIETIERAIYISKKNEENTAFNNIQIDHDNTKEIGKIALNIANHILEKEDLTLKNSFVRQRIN